MKDPESPTTPLIPHSATPQHAPPALTTGSLWLGMVFGNLVIAALYFGLCAIADVINNRDIFQWVALPNFFLIPMAGGIAVAWIWRRHQLSTGIFAINTIWMTLLGMLGAALILKEGVICLIIVAPMLYVAIFCGALLGRVWFKSKSWRLHFCSLPIIALMGVIELANRTPSQSVVVDEILIQAPPAKVWPHVLAFEPIQEPPNYWMFKLGLPYPMETTNGGNFVGASRQCIFSDNIVIKETIAEFEPEKRLTFDISEQPTHPEAYGHITLHRGRFDLRDNHDGTTTLIGSSWYTLHVSPLGYFDLWTQAMTRAVHMRVMENVKRESENRL